MRRKEKKDEAERGGMRDRVERCAGDLEEDEMMEKMEIQCEG